MANAHGNAVQLTLSRLSKDLCRFQLSRLALNIVRLFKNGCLCSVFCSVFDFERFRTCVRVFHVRYFFGFERVRF